MGTSIEVNHSDFAQAVINASYQQPVLVDFFAQWCGPCKMLKPMLEKLALEYDFVLAKVDIDANPELASTYQVEGVPDVRVVSQGEVQPGFVGVLPEPQLREFLAKLNLQSDLQAGLLRIQTALAQGDRQTARSGFAQLIDRYPQSRELAIAAAQFLIQEEKFDSATKLLTSVLQAENGDFPDVQALLALMQLKQAGQASPKDQPHDAEFFAAIDNALSGNYETAFQRLLGLIAKDRKYRSDGARKTMLLLFDLLSSDHPLTKQYRKQLTLTLY